MDYELLELKREFLAEADGKVREIQNVLDGERDSKALDRLAYLAHQLKGSGGSYGYARISSDAACRSGVSRSLSGPTFAAITAPASSSGPSCSMPAGRMPLLRSGCASSRP